MTSTVQDAVPEATAVAGADPNEIVRGFAANSPFRAAESHELVNEDNPFRRPVRPDDLGWLDYSTVLDRSQVLLLSSLLGHRMLRNAYDVDPLYVAPRGGGPADADGAAFYSPENRIRSAAASAVLERHLFGFLADQRTELPGGSAGALIEQVRGYREELLARPGETFAVAAGLSDRVKAATFVLLQLTASEPASWTAIARNAVGEYDLAHPGLRSRLLGDYTHWVGQQQAYADMLALAELSPAPAAYWQLHLTTSIAVGNHLHMVSRNHEHFFQFLGAWLHKKVHAAATSTAYSSLLDSVFGKANTFFSSVPNFDADAIAGFVTDLVTPLQDRFGERAVAAVHEGFGDARCLTEIWDQDLAAQLAWADQIDVYKEKAEKLDHKITEEKIDIDLDTFVESEEETSTTHVHDDHRLVIVEVGEMHFWNNVGEGISLKQGDKLLIPTSRLHGSTVLTGSCTYHQPIIPDEMYREF